MKPYESFSTALFYIGVIALMWLYVRVKIAIKRAKKRKKRAEQLAALNALIDKKRIEHAAQQEAEWHEQCRRQTLYFMKHPLDKEEWEKSKRD